MSYLGNEYTLAERPAIDYLVNKLGYTYLDGTKLTAETGERESSRGVILVKHLESGLKKLNPWMNHSNLTKAIYTVSHGEQLGTSLHVINEKLYHLIVNLGLSLEQDIDGSGKKQYNTVKFIDFENVSNNTFHVVSQLKIKGVNENCIPDLIIYINGIPVVVIECKSPFKEKESKVRLGKKDGYEQLRRYMNLRGAQMDEGIDQLFHTNFITGIFNKYHGYVGTISSKYNHYLEWKDPYPYKKKDIEDVANNGQNIFIQGILEKENLLKIMQHFILFEEESGNKIKKVARYQQFRAVNKALDRIDSGKTPLDRGGVIWATQGSGKSLSMVMLARLIRRTPSLKDSTIVVITDRVDLDKQIYDTFCRVFPELTLGQKDEDKLLVRVKSVKAMKDLLSKAQPKIIMTTIHKFQSKNADQVIFEDDVINQSLFFEEEVEVLSNKSNIIVMTDEAHRSQYSSLAMNMRMSLPSAAFIGFTGTPIEKDDKDTYRTFGKKIDQYTLSEAVEDGATVGIVYEGRKPELQVKVDTLEEIFKEGFSTYTEEEREAIKAKYANKQAIAEADERIDEIARDLLMHYKENIYPNGFKAQIVCVSRRACAKYYKALNKHMTEFFEEPLEAKVIYSCDNNEVPELKIHKTTKPEQDAMIDRFKKPIEKDRLCFLIVKDMLLTGFDAPIEQVMYLDRPLKEHTLLQAIARTNRTYIQEKNSAPKKYGFIVDYYGIMHHLEEALKVFDKSDIDGQMESLDALYKKMQDYKEAVLRMFMGVDRRDLDAVMRVIEPENKRAEFEMAYKRYATSLEALMPNHVSKDDLNDLKWMAYVRAGAKARFEPEKALDIADCGQKAREIISEHLQAKGVVQWIRPISLLSDDFQETMDTLKSDEAIASSMEHAIKHIISVKMEDNPVHFTSLLEKLQKLLDETQLSWEERRARLKEFIDNEIELSEEDEAGKLGFTSNKEYAFYLKIKEVLNEEEPAENQVAENTVSYTTDADIALYKEMTNDIVHTIKANRLDGFATNKAKADEVERAIFKILSKKYFHVGYNKLKQLINPLLELAKRHYATDHD
ncbi:type I restriction endonuclease subunit R [Marinisporobacter balticus]|uniref:Type I restriction enzyme endonuclease subunit n=1 Tax=Marinisporobacter balticus TaxID=2018667 RepID=A0A4R2KCN1_9FIRM|nr:type I restriction endonuclease subunit R [Marinisporobacter balticus]TCO70664.1 type I restriction enzyme R subunit [Marinisporobacter balticus]